MTGIKNKGMDKPLHEYRRPVTDEEIETAAKMLAEGSSVRAIEKALNTNWNRAKRICTKAETLIAANRIRETQVIPEALIKITSVLEANHQQFTEMNRRQSSMESQMRTMGKALGMAKLRDRNQRERLRSQKDELKELRAIIRKHGLL